MSAIELVHFVGVWIFLMGLVLVLELGVAMGFKFGGGVLPAKCMRV